MAAEMEEVERAEVSVERDNVDVARAGLDDDHADNVASLKFDVKVGVAFDADSVGAGAGWNGRLSWLAWGCDGALRVTLLADEMLPSGFVVLLADGVELMRVVHAGLGIAVEVDADSVELGDGFAGVGIASVDEAAGHLDHGAVEGEVVVELGSLAELGDSGGEPVGGLVRGRRCLRERG